MLISYARVSTDAQDLTAQRDALAALGVPAECAGRLPSASHRRPRLERGERSENPQRRRARTPQPPWLAGWAPRVPQLMGTENGRNSAWLLWETDAGERRSRHKVIADEVEFLSRPREDA